MLLRRLRTILGDLRRLREILSVVWEVGGGLLVEQLRLKYLVPLRCRIHCALHPRHPDDCLVRMCGEQIAFSGDVLRSVLERLGPTFVKLGQVLSLRADVVGEEISSKLSGLQSNVPAFPYEVAQRIIREELGRNPEAIYRSFDPQPVAAASLSQVHRAVLPDGTEVAVKVQRPEIERTIRQDIGLLSFLARLAERLPRFRPYGPRRIVDEFADWTLAELDFAREGHNADRVRFMFADDPHIHVPRIHWAQSSRRVLTMDFVHGIKADDLAGMQRLNVDSQQLAMHGVRAMCRMFFLEGFFHADPHPGNFFALENDTLCLHDFGMVGTLSRRQRHTLLRAVLAFMNRDIDGYVEHFQRLAILSSESETAAYEKDLAGILSELCYSPVPSSNAWAFFRAINKGAQHGVRFPADLALFGKAMITTEAMGRKLYPDFQFDEQLQPFVRDAIEAYVKRLKRSLEGSLIETLDLMEELPNRLRAILEIAERRALRVEIDGADFASRSRKPVSSGLVLLGTASLAAIFGTGYFVAREGIDRLAEFSAASVAVGASAVLLAWLAARIFRGGSPR